MSAGSAFASGVRAGQNIWNSAVNNAMAGKRLDMLRTQFQFEQAKRKTDASNLTKAQTALNGFLKETSSITNMLEPEQYEAFTAAQLKAIPIVSLSPEVNKTFADTVKVINKRTLGESGNALLAERGLLATEYRSYYKGQDFPMVETAGNQPAIDWPQVTELVKIKKEEYAQKSDLRKIDFKSKQNWAENKPNEPYPGGEVAKQVLLNQAQTAKRDADFFDADTKDKIKYRGDFNTWKRDVVKNDSLNANDPEAQKMYRTFSHDEKISGLMAEAGLEAFKLSDELIPDPVSGGYTNMAEVTGMINDMIRKQEEDAGLKKAMAQKPLTESQAKDYIFSGRLKLTEETMAKLEARGFRPESIPQAIFMTGLPELAKTNDQKLYIAARANWIGAQLRRLSGAAIKPEEYAQDIQEYFPLINDSPEVIAYKRDLRRQVERDMRAIATNQPVVSDYKTTGKQVTYNNIADVEDAVSRGRLKVGDTYKYKTQLGEIQNGVVQPPAP